MDTKTVPTPSGGGRNRELPPPYYIGKHSTDRLSDGYRGSGGWLREECRPFDCRDFMTEKVSFHGSKFELYWAEDDLIRQHLGLPKCRNKPIRMRTPLSRYPAPPSRAA